MAQDPISPRQQDRPRLQLSSYTATDQQPCGIVCSKCGCQHFFVVYTRPIPGGIRRSRQCRNCGKRVITTERLPNHISAMARLQEDR